MALSVLSNSYTLISKKLCKVCLNYIFEYLSDMDIIFTGKVDPKLNQVAYEILCRKKKLKVEFRDRQYSYYNDVFEAIKIAGRNLETLYIKGRFYYDMFQRIHPYCPSIKSLELNLHKFNNFEINHCLTELNELKLRWQGYNWYKKLSDELKDGIKDLLKKSPKLQILHLTSFEESDLVEMKFPKSLKELRFKCCEIGNLLKKIQRECRELEKLVLFPDVMMESQHYLELNEVGRNCPNIKHLDLILRERSNLNVSFLSTFHNLKELYLTVLECAIIDLNQLFYWIPKIETLHLESFLIQGFNNADISNLKNFGYTLDMNKQLGNLEKLSSLEVITFYDRTIHSSVIDTFWNFFFEIVPYLEMVEIIQFVGIDYEDSFYERLKILTQNREKKIRIRIKNPLTRLIPKDNNDKFIIEILSHLDLTYVDRIFV